MSSPWRVRHRRADGSRCDHFSDEACEACDADKQRPVAAPTTQSFYLDAKDLEQTLFAPWETPHSIESRAELLRVCEERGLDSRYLKESVVWPHRKPREQ